jgi:hypothetical protein
MFGKVKSALIEQEISNEMYLLKAVIEILNAISDAGVQCVFGNGIARVERVIDTRQDYLTEQIFPVSL